MANKTAGVGLYKSCENGNYEVVSKMLATVEGIDINYQNPEQDGNTPLIIAASNGHSSIVSCLLEAGADHKIQNQLGFTALQIASVNGNSSIIKSLMNADDQKAKTERNNSLKLPLDSLTLATSTVDPHDSSGLVLENISESPQPPQTKKKRAASVRGSSPQRKVSFAENATSSVMIIPSKEDVKLMLHKNEYNHVCSPALGGSLEASFDGFTSTVKNMASPIVKLKFKRKMKRNGTIVPYTPTPHKVPPNTPASSAKAAPVVSPSSPAPSSGLASPVAKEEKPSVAATALSLHSISTEEAGFPSGAPALSVSTKSLSFKNAAHVALATVHAPKRVDEVTEEDDTISMSVDLSAMGLYVSFDDLENPVLKKVVQKPASLPPSESPTAATTPSSSDKKEKVEPLSAVVEPSSSSSSAPPPRTPIRGLSRETGQSFEKKIEAPLVIASPSEPEKIEAKPALSMEAEINKVTPPTVDDKRSPSNASEEGVSSHPIESVTSDESITYSETPSTKIPFAKKNSRSESIQKDIPIQLDQVVQQEEEVHAGTVVAVAATVEGQLPQPMVVSEVVPAPVTVVDTNLVNSAIEPVVKTGNEVEVPKVLSAAQEKESAFSSFDSAPLSTIEEGTSEKVSDTPSSSSKIRDARRHAGDFGNPFSSEHLKEVFEAAQAEVNGPVEEKRISVVTTASGAKKLQLHHVSDVVAEAIRQNIAHPVTFAKDGVVKPQNVAKVRAAASSFSASTTLSANEVSNLVSAVAPRSVSFAADAVSTFKQSADAAVAAVHAAETTKPALMDSPKEAAPVVSFSVSSDVEVAKITETKSTALASISEDDSGDNTPIPSASVSGAATPTPVVAAPPPAPKLVTIPLVGRKQSVVSVGGRKKSLAMLLSPTVKAIGSATKAGESVESLRSKMFQEAKRRAEEYAEQQARKKEEAAMLAALLKAKQEAEQKRLADLKAKQDAIIARKGKAKGYGFQSIKAGLRYREYKDTLHNSPYIRMVMEKDPDDSDSESDWEDESVKKPTPKHGGAPGMPSSVPSSTRNSDVEVSQTTSAALAHGAHHSTLPGIEVNQNVSNADLISKAVSLWGETVTINETEGEKTRSREAVSSMLQINDPVSNQAQSVRKTLAMIQSDLVLENKFKWAKKIAKRGSAALLTEYHDVLKEQYEEEQSRLFHSSLPDIKKTKHPKRAQTAGPHRTKPSLCVMSTQIIGSHLSEAQHFAESVNNHNQSMYIPSDTPLKPSQQALMNTKPKKQFQIVNISAEPSESAAGVDHHKSQEESKDNSLKAMSLELEETIYNKINENNGSLVFIDSAKDLSWHEFNVQKIEPHADAQAFRAGTPQALAAARKFYNNHQIGIGKLVNAYRPWSSPAKLHKPKTVPGFDDSAPLMELEEPDQLSMTVESTTVSNTVMSQSLPGSRAGGPRERHLRPESASPSPTKFEGNLTLDGGSLIRSQMSMGSSLRKRLPLMINLVKANIPRRTWSGSEDGGGEEEEEKGSEQ